MTKFKTALTSTFLILLSSTVSALEVNFKAFDAPSGFLYHSEKSIVVEYLVENADLTILMFPGGEGYLGFNKPYEAAQKIPQKITYNGKFNDITKQLIDPAKFNRKINIVLVDSPYPLKDLKNQANFGFPVDRAHSEHQDRLMNVFNHYKKTYNKPIWIFGHSNGTFSTTSFIQTLRKAGRLNELAGIVLSGSRALIEISEPVDLPIVFVHHERDECKFNSYPDALKNHEKFKTLNKQKTEFFTIRGGDAENKDPCDSGLHMYFNAYDEVATILNKEIR